MECVILKLVDGHHIAVSGEPEGHLCYCVRLLFYKDMKFFFTCACHFFMDKSFLQGHEYIFGSACLHIVYVDAVACLHIVQVITCLLLDTEPNQTKLL